MGAQAEAAALRERVAAAESAATEAGAARDALQAALASKVLENIFSVNPTINAATLQCMDLALAQARGHRPGTLYCKVSSVQILCKV